MRSLAHHRPGRRAVALATLAATLLVALLGWLGVTAPFDTLLSANMARLDPKPFNQQIVPINIASQGRGRPGEANDDPILAVIEKADREGAKGLYLAVGLPPRGNDRVAAAIRAARVPIRYTPVDFPDRKMLARYGAYYGPDRHPATVRLAVDGFGLAQGMRRCRVVDDVVLPGLVSLRPVQRDDCAAARYDMAIAAPAASRTVWGADDLKSQSWRGRYIVAGSPAFANVVTPPHGDQPIEVLASLVLQTELSGGLREVNAFIPALMTGFIVIGLTLLLWSYPRLLTAGMGVVLAAWVLAHFVASRMAVDLPIVSALLIVAVSIWYGTFITNRHRKTRENSKSGLPTFAVLEQEAMRDSRPLVVLKIANYSEITATLPRASELDLLRQIVARLQLGSGSSDIFHGDDGYFGWFIVDDRHIEERLDGLHALMSVPVVVAGQSFDMAAAFGYDTSAPGEAANRVNGARAAADRAARAGERTAFFDPSRIDEAAWRLSMLGQLDEAIDRDELWIAYQPKEDLRAGDWPALEALVRWQHPTKGNVPPDDFIPLAEQSGRIEKLTRFVLGRALADLHSLMTQGYDLEMCVNLSARLLERADIAETIGAMLVRFRVDPSRLTIELTETAAFAETMESLGQLQRIRDLGVRISIDDYGKGFSSLTYLRSVPADEIKIDRSFIDAMSQSPSDYLLVNSTIELAHQLGKSVVAEGVQEAGTLDRLREMGCDFGQGYWICKPARITQLVESGKLRFKTGQIIPLEGRLPSP